MTRRNNKITSKTAKTILFSALVMTLMLPVTAMNVAQAAQLDTQDKIPTGKLMERLATKWQKQYKNTEEFSAKQNAIKGYVNADLQNNGWNQFMVKENIRIHNFDTIIGKVGYGHELVALSAAKDRLLGIYDANEPVVKFHNWLLSKYSVPTTVELIDERIATIASDNVPLVTEVVTAFNNMAERGNVPDELINQDMEYWIMIANVSVCQYDVNCDFSTMQNMLKNESYRTQNTIIPILDILRYILPNAYAITNQPHYGYVYGKPYTCDYGTCGISLSAGPYSNSFTLTISDPPYPYHSIGKTMYVYASTCSSTVGATSKVIGNLYVGVQTFPFSKQVVGGCAISEATYTVANNPTATWHWIVESTHTAWT